MPEVNYVWDPIEDNVIRERDENGNTLVDYTTRPSLYGSVLSQDRGGEVRHFHFDGQGNTTDLTDENGVVTDTRRYSAFGEVTESTGTTEFRISMGVGGDITAIPNHRAFQFEGVGLQWPVPVGFPSILSKQPAAIYTHSY